MWCFRNRRYNREERISLLQGKMTQRWSLMKIMTNPHEDHVQFVVSDVLVTQRFPHRSPEWTGTGTNNIHICTYMYIHAHACTAKTVSLMIEIPRAACTDLNSSMSKPSSSSSSAEANICSKRCNFSSVKESSILAVTKHNTCVNVHLEFNTRRLCFTEMAIFS